MMRFVYQGEGGREGEWGKVEMDGERMGGMNEWRVEERKE